MGGSIGLRSETPATQPGMPPALAAPALDVLPEDQREAMRVAGREVLECHRVLHKGGLNLVGEVLRGAGTFYEMNHYPEDYVYDPESHAQYYYHAHRGLEGEHGHFHTFLRRAGMPDGAVPAQTRHADPLPSGEEALAHLISIAMDGSGLPIGLFAPNRWVAGDTWYEAPALLAMLPRFRIDHAFPSWPLNRWISAMMTLFRPHIEVLLNERDRSIANWREAYPNEDVLERRDIEILAWMPISVDATLAPISAVRDSPMPEEK